MAADKDEDIYLAKLAEQAERYEEMVTHMKKVANTGVQLGNEERNLLSVAYKNVIGTRRASWRIVSTLEQKEEDMDPSSGKLDIIREFRSQIEDELKDICNDILQLLDDRLIAKDTTKIDSKDTESQVFYMKMKGDYKRYIAEFSTGQERKDAAEESLLGYSNATELAKNLEPTHPIRLGLALNFSVFYYEILNSPERACKLAKDVFDEAIQKLDKLPEDNYKDSTLIMQLLRDNLTLWTTDMEGQGEGGQEQTNLQDLEDEDQ